MVCGRYCKKHSLVGLYASYRSWQRILLLTMRSHNDSDTAHIPASSTSLDAKLVVFPDLVFTSSLRATDVLLFFRLKMAKKKDSNDSELLIFFWTIPYTCPCCDIFMQVLSVVNLERCGEATKRTWVCACDSQGGSNDLNTEEYYWLLLIPLFLTGPTSDTFL